MKVIKIESKLPVHLLFCVLVLIVLLSGTLFLQSQGFRMGSWPMLAARFAFFIGCIYTGRWISIRWLANNSFLLLVFNMLICCVAITVCWWMIIRYIMGSIYAGFMEVMISASPFFSIALVAGILLKMIRATMKMQVEQAQLQMEQKQGQLDLLQSQLSPHFLFNTLNNLYGISLTQQTRIPKLLLQLSDLLRYTVYDTKNAFVDVNDEIRYIHNFIDFEKIRISDRLVMDEDIEDLSGSGVKIAPMILILFIENAFKHAKDSFDQKIYISIRLYIEYDELVFCVKNSFRQEPAEGRIGKHSGIGLSNTVKRLDLLYNKKYRLHQSCEDQQYKVELRLPIRIV